MTPWPRRLINFPIILIAIVQEYLWAISLIWDRNSINVTAINILSNFMSVAVLNCCVDCGSDLGSGPIHLSQEDKHSFGTGAAAVHLYLSAGGAMKSIYLASLPMESSGHRHSF